MRTTKRGADGQGVRHVSFSPEGGLSWEKPGGGARCVLNFDIAGGDPGRVALFRDNSPVGFVNRHGDATGEKLYMPGTVYLEGDGLGGYCFVCEADEMKPGEYRVYEFGNAGGKIVELRPRRLFDALLRLRGLASGR